VRRNAATGALDVVATGVERLDGLSLGAPSYYVTTGFSQRPKRLALDRLGALYATSKALTIAGIDSAKGIAKVRPDTHVTLFALALGDPQGVALAPDGSLYAADGERGGLIRFRAPPAPTLDALPEFFNHKPLAGTGTADAGARVDVFVDDATKPMSVVAGKDGRLTDPSRCALTRPTRWRSSRRRAAATA
jgi:hypothetical protein